MHPQKPVATDGPARAGDLAVADGPARSGNPSLAQRIFSRRMAICALLGFSSGLPLYTLISLLPAWLTREGIALAAIGYLSGLRVPYTWKFLWAPLLDRFKLPGLGRWRGWMLATQLALLLALAAFALLGSPPKLFHVAAITLIIAALGATQDIALDAYRREVLPDEELALGNSIWVNSYRVAGFVPGALALLLADHVPWRWVHLFVGACMSVGVVATLLAPNIPQNPEAPTRLRAAIVGPFVEFFKRSDLKTALQLLLFLFLYKLGDNLATSLITPFYLHNGFTLTEIATVAKPVSLASIVGGLCGGVMILRLGINRALWWFGWVQLLSTLGFAGLAQLGHNLWALGAAVLFEYLGVGLGTAAFVAFIARATNKRFSATQYALFSSFVALPGTVAGAFAGKLIELLGYTSFFILCTALAIPGMLMLPYVAPLKREA
jgi:MFS transporter, PAT family, beta-lactamase induction signal transducer AmpG